MDRCTKLIRISLRKCWYVECSVCVPAKVYNVQAHQKVVTKPMWFMLEGNLRYYYRTTHDTFTHIVCICFGFIRSSYSVLVIIHNNRLKLKRRAWHCRNVNPAYTKHDLPVRNVYVCGFFYSCLWQFHFIFPHRKSIEIATLPRIRPTLTLSKHFWLLQNGGGDSSHSKQKQIICSWHRHLSKKELYINPQSAYAQCP